MYQKVAPVFSEMCIKEANSLTLDNPGSVVLRTVLYLEGGLGHLLSHVDGCLGVQGHWACDQGAGPSSKSHEDDHLVLELIYY